VTLASCALPGVFKPRKLQAKTSKGIVEDFEVDGVEWIELSVQADLPFERMSTLSNVSNYMVCQTNFHIQPFLERDQNPNSNSSYWRMFKTVEWDIRALKLSRMGVMPRLFGQDVGAVFSQKYDGHLTLMPRFTTFQTFGFKALQNPSQDDMEHYLHVGAGIAWPYIDVIRNMVRIEKTMDDGLERLKKQSQQCRLGSEITDAVESLSSRSIVIEINHDNLTGLHQK
jgi:TAG lipase / steryl ester hydrolase / phospholipase A2 / LPA acyltransferase